MKILLTGATGFIGKHLIEKLQDDGRGLCVLVRDSTNLNFLKKEKIKYYILKNNNVDDLISFMQKEKFDGVVHLASLFLAQHKPEDVGKLINSNIHFGSILLEASVQSNVGWFINTGTFWQHYKNKDYSPVNLYAATKKAFEDIARYYIEISNLNFVTIKLSDTFGPNDPRPKILNLLNKIGQTGETLDMSGGKQIINISYIDNVIDGFRKMINLLSKDKKRKLCGKDFAINSNERISLRKLAELFEKTTKKKLNINWGGRGYRLREVMKPWEMGENIPGWNPRVSIKEGIKRTFK